MCTLSWTTTASGYEVYFNRDEDVNRAAEVPPVEADLGGVRHLAPRDGAAGGTWISVNQYGVTTALLNDYLPDRDSSRPPLRSRGLLVLDQAGAASVMEIAERLDGLDLSPYEPFALCSFQPIAPTSASSLGQALQWDGSKLHARDLDEGSPPESSSAFDPEGARARRTAEWNRLRALGPMSADRIAGFHASHLDGPDAHSPCMHRLDAVTRSMVHVRVEPERVMLEYTPGSPCRTKALPPLALERRIAPAPRG